MTSNVPSGTISGRVRTWIGKFLTGLKEPDDLKGKPNAHLETHWVIVPGRPRAIRRGMLILCALLIGALLLERKTLVGGVPVDTWWLETKDELLNHVGSAFLVSAIVIFAFEWASEASLASSLAATLSNMLGGQVQTVLQASSRDAVARAMKDLCGTHGDVLEAQFKEFAESISKLEKRGGWTADGYFEFIAWYHKQLCDKVAKLAGLSAALKDHPEAAQEFPFPLPNASDVADVMLARTTTAMMTAGGGTYHALSDAFTWTKLEEFRATLFDAVQKNFKVRRLFVVGKPSDRDLPMTELASVIYGHFEEAQKAERYDMRIIDEDEYRENEPLELSHMEHFGIFEPAAGESSVMFAVQKSELSDYRIAGGTKAERAIKAFKSLFERFPRFRDLPAYKKLAEEDERRLPTPVSGDILIRDYLIAYRVKRMRHLGEYHGVSDIVLWKDGELEHFHAACNHKIARTETTFQRIFFFVDEALADDPKVIDVLRRHLADSTKDLTRKGTYEWQVCMLSTVPEAIREEGTFGTFQDIESDDGEIVGEVAIKNVRHLFAQDKATFRRLTENFKTFWKSLAEKPENKSLAERLKGKDAPSRSTTVKT